MTYSVFFTILKSEPLSIIHSITLVCLSRTYHNRFMFRSSQAVELSVIKKYNNYYERTKYLLVVIEEKKLVQIEDKEFWLYLSTTY